MTTSETWGAYKLHPDGWWKLDAGFIPLFEEMFTRWLIACREWPSIDMREDEPDGPSDIKLALRREFERRG